ncbi:dihydrofolate reductase family protein [Methanosphaerula palustris]|uniref:Bifunctional deaminase-reductase domain protein n=1 Tax=Methanosphaerula palustris (strain ATCC BAA-1556 / DSM 19958 / E1-9c) TaxID=521011 RepID=B8GHZ8_METPE|nr:dihydrofolate reductase family protein [Methanosphaerula palustris]ACL16738.1 bifunctional deaminase-reductase domain protein [Methanosphaerula palustris E1-9c]
MGNLNAFTIVSVDGYFAGPNGEIDWFKDEHSDEEKEFSAESSKKADLLIFGRTTYEMMKSYWPTTVAIKADPVTAGMMNRTPKIVFSKTMDPEKDGPVWKNVRVIHEIRPEEVLSLKKQGSITILGSGTIVQQLTTLGLIDEYQLMVVPVILGSGKYLFRDVNRMNLTLTGTRVFQKSGRVLLTYQPAGRDTS